MTTFFKSFPALLLAACALTVSAQGTNRTAILKLNHTDTPSGARHQASEFFAKRVEEFSKGKYRILVFHSGQLGNDPQSIKALGEGKLDFTTSATGSFAGLVPELNLTALPYLVGSYEQGWRFYDESPWLRTQFDKLPAKGVRHLATWEAGFRSFTTKSALNKPEDAVGKKMRVFPNEMIKWTVKSIGYKAVVIPATEVYSAIQQGRADGQENPIDTIRALRFSEVAPNVALAQHVYSPLPFVASEATWKKLSAAGRDYFQRAAREAAALSRKLVKEADEKNLEFMRLAGAKILMVDTDPFRKAMASVYVKAKTFYGSDVDAILKDTRQVDKLSAR